MQFLSYPLAGDLFDHQKHYVFSEKHLKMHLGINLGISTVVYASVKGSVIFIGQLGHLGIIVDQKD